MSICPEQSPNSQLKIYRDNAIMLNTAITYNTTNTILDTFFAIGISQSESLHNTSNK